MKSNRTGMNNEKKFGFFEIPQLIKSYVDSRNKYKNLSDKYDVEKNTRHRARFQKQLDDLGGEKRFLMNQLLFRAFLLSVGGLAVGTGIHELSKQNTSYERHAVRQELSKDLNEREKSKIDIHSDVGIRDVIPIEPFIPQTSDYNEAMVQLQDYWKNISLDALKFFKEADPRLETLINFMKEKAITTIPVNQKITMRVGIGEDATSRAIAEMENPDTFEIVFMPDRFARFMPSSIMTEASGRTVRIATTFKSKRWLGIMLAHELSHVEDQIVHGEDSTNRGEYSAGEVRSHLLENKLLRFWDPKMYDYFIDNAIPLYEEACRTNDETNLKKFIAKLYPVDEPSVSHNESKLAYASCIIAVAFEDALRNGSSINDLSKVYVDVGDKFMRRSNQ